MHTVIFSCQRKQIQMGRLGWAAACLDSTQKQVKNGAKTVEINVGGSRPKPPRLKAGKVLLSAEKLRLSSFVTLRFTQLERSWNCLQISKKKTALMRFSLGVIATKQTKYKVF